MCSYFKKKKNQVTDMLSIEFFEIHISLSHLFSKFLYSLN